MAGGSAGRPERPVALVTGASSGIGGSIARVAAREGYDLVVVARSEEALTQLAVEVCRHHGVDTEVLVADLADPEGIGAVERRLAQADRPVDVLVNNAGVGSGGAFVELDIDGEVAQIDLNVTALVRLTHAALPGMVARQKGGIINVGSLGSFQPAAYNATYSATKAFVLSFTEAVHEEVRSSGVRVSCLCPGFTHTGFQATSGMYGSSLPDVVWQTASQVAEAAWSGLERNQAVVVPGVVNKATVVGVRLLPRSIVRKVSGYVAKRL